MGNSSSSARSHHDDTVDFGSLVPQGVYTGQQDWNQAVVAQLIVQRKLAPFYRPLEEYDESWDEEQILASRKELPENPETANPGETAPTPPPSKPEVGSSFRSHGKRPSTQKEVAKFSEAVVYRGALECPICFLVCPFPTFDTHKTHQLFSFSISPPATSSWIHCFVDSDENPPRFRSCCPTRLRDRRIHVCLSCSRGSVLPPEYQLLEVLRPGDMYGMLCTNQAIRSNDNSLGFRTGGMSLLRAGAFRGRVHPALLEDRDWRRRFGMSPRRVSFRDPNHIFVRRLRHGMIPPRGHPRQKSQWRDHVAVRASVLTAPKL